MTAYIDASYSQPANQAIYASSAPCSIQTGAYDDWNNVTARCYGEIVAVGAHAVIQPVSQPARRSLSSASSMAASDAPERPWFLAMLAGLALILALRGFIHFSGGSGASLGRSGA